MSWSETLFLKKVIDGKKGLVSSNNLYANILSNPITVALEEELTRDLIKFKWSGSAKIVITTYKKADRPTRIGIVKNGTLVYDTSTDTGTATREFIITFAPGDVVGLYARGTSTNFRVESFDLYADIIDSSAYKML